MVSAQSQPFTIVDISTVSVKVNVSEKLINTISVGDEVPIQIEALENSDIVGTVETVSPVADGTNTYPVKIKIENSDGLIKAGMFAKVNFTEQSSGDAIVLPVDVVLTSGDKKYVYIAEDGKPVKKEVQTGLDNGTKVEITSGISVGDEIIVTGQEYVDEKTAIKIVNGEASEEASSSGQSGN
jgi:RND family efflux transporter MFP subunit